MPLMAIILGCWFTFGGVVAVLATLIVRGANPPHDGLGDDEADPMAALERRDHRPAA